MNQIYFCLFATLLCGLWCCFMSVSLGLAFPIIALDAILTPTELADESLRDRVRDSLSRATFREAILWFVTGLFLVSISGYGLWIAARDKKPGS